MNKYFNNPAFNFLISLSLVASCGLGSYLAGTQSERGLFETTETATTILPTSQPATPSPTIDAANTLSAEPLVVHFIDVGQGDAILVVSPDGLAALIDGGSGGTGEVAYLQGQGVERIDLMVATHPHDDHIGGLIQVLEAMPVARVVTNAQPHTPATYEPFLDAILSSGAEYSEVQRGDTIALGNLEFSVFNPDGTLGDDMNENSIVLRLVYGQTTFLFMGDAEINIQSSMLAAGLPVKADILKVAHHGSCDALNWPFLDAVQPEVGIYSAGRDNQLDLPCLATIHALDQRGILVLGTDVNGSIIVTVTEDAFRIANAAGEDLGR